MIRILIDPPCGPVSSAAEIELWIAQLESMRVMYRNDRERLSAIDRYVAGARLWLACQAEQRQRNLNSNDTVRPDTADRTSSRPGGQPDQTQE